VALGIFIGCTPLYGLHLTLCVLCARWLGLNRVKTYLAAHISTPVLMPFLLFFEVQTGRLVRRQPLLSIHLSQVPALWRWDARHLEFWHWKSWLDLVVGSVVLGAVLAGAGALLTFWLLRRGQRPPAVEALIEETAHRYLGAGLLSCEVVRGKLRHDPVYFDLLRQGGLPCRGRLLDLGCGRGVALALLAAARAQLERGTWPAGWPQPPALQLTGIEAAAEPAVAARAGLCGQATIETADLLAADLPAADAVLLIDVLRYLPAAQQEQILARAAAILPPGGILLLREADAGAGWRFLGIQVAERLRTLVQGNFRQWRRGFHYRTTAEWLALLARHGLTGEMAPREKRPACANVLLRATRA
jgi:uncharacterized protein (DUF2062 family)/2-polyprenyl-3-methyl-5-hydroxy-6-metoxy-1,4-benzoquinol methylase